MKNFKMMAFAFFIAASVSVSAQTTKKIDPTKSKISWVGKKVTGEHSGVVNLSEGYFVFDGAKLTGGSFTVDMNSLTVTDLNSGQGKEKLEGHLKHDDFFGTEAHPTATYSFKSATAKGGNVYTLNGVMTVKGVSHPQTIEISMTKNTALANFKIDRTKYGIKYGSGSFFDNLGDRAINDDFDVKVSLVF
jgi:polyisoprenoid-binding protein YceI